MNAKKAILFRVFEDNPEMRKIEKAVEILKNGGVVIYPTDTIYAMGCNFNSPRSAERLSRIKGNLASKINFSLICYDISMVSEYANNITTPVYKVLKKGLPGPFTFILHANNKVLRSIHSTKKTVGIRVPNNNIARLIVRELGNPMLSTSIRDDDEVIEYSTDPSLIYEKFEYQVDAVIDGGYGKNVASTIVDCTGDEFEVTRQGQGDFNTLI